MRILSILTISLFSVFSYSQDSLRMERVAEYSPTPGALYNDVWGFSDGGNEYAVFGSRTTMFVMDVTDCSNPQEIYSFDGGGNGVWRDFKYYDGHIYMSCDGCSEGLNIFSASGGSVSHVLNTNEFFNKAHNIFIDEAQGKLYGVGINSSSGSGNDMVILDLTVDPADPTLIESVDFGDGYYIHDVFVQNDTAYCSHGYTGLVVWDLTDPANPVNIGTHDAGGYNHSSWISSDNNYLYYAEEVPAGQSMQTINLSTLGPNNALISDGSFQHPLGNVGFLRPHNPFVNGDKLYISYYHDGVKVYGLTDPSAPQLIAYYDTYPDNGDSYSGFDGVWGVYPFLDSGCILASDDTYGLQLLKYDASIPAYPDYRPVLTVQQNTLTGSSSLDVVFSLTEKLYVDTSSPIVVAIARDNKLNPNWDSSLSSVGSIPVQNSLWTYDSSDPNYHKWTYNEVLEAGEALAFGFVANFDPKNTDGTMTITANIIGGSGGEDNIINNERSAIFSWTAN